MEKSSKITNNGEKIIGNNVISNLYGSVDYNPVWTYSKNINDMVSILEGSYYKGLNPEDYHLTHINVYLSTPHACDDHVLDLLCKYERR